MRNICTLVLVAMLSTGMPAKICAQVAVSDSLALVDFYNATGGPGWTHRTNWLTAAPVRDWYGVIVENGRVTVISLDHNYIRGFIPESFSDLTALTYINFSNNFIEGLPAHIGKLVNMEEMNFSENYITDTLPASIGNCRSLRILNLNDNGIKLPPSFGDLDNLENLNLNHCGLSSFPIVITGCKNLEELSIQHAGVYDSLPSAIGNCKKLTKLELEGSGFYGIVPSSIGSCTKLKTLELSYNQFSGELPATIGNCTNLKNLYLQSNNFTGPLPGAIGNCIKLVEMDINRNHFNGSMPSSIGSCTQLAKLYVYLNELTFIPDEIGGCVNLEEFIAYRNKITNIPAGIGECVKLITLDLSENDIQTNMPASIGNCTSLVSVFLLNNHVSGPIPSTIGNLVNLVTFDARNNNFSGRIPPGIGNCKKLKTLELDYNNLSGSIPDSLGKCSSLVYMGLYSNNLSGKVPLFDQLTEKCEIGLGYNALIALPDPGNVSITNRIFLEGNRLDFSDLESIADNFTRANYESQSNIPLNRGGNKLSVHAGGTLSYNVYSWFKDGALIKTKRGDSVLTLTGPGTYYASVRNRRVDYYNTRQPLILISDTLTVTTLATGTNETSSIDLIKSSGDFTVFPNPARDILNIVLDKSGNALIRISDGSGKIVYSTRLMIVAKQAFAIDIQKLLPGNYFVTVNIDEVATKQKFIKTR